MPTLAVTQGGSECPVYDEEGEGIDAVVGRMSEKKTEWWTRHGGDPF
jgi:hypothetical protein